MATRIGVDDIVEDLKNARGRTKKACLLIGAGCSVSAGVPTAAGIVDLIRKQHPTSWDRANPKTYPNCMEQLSRAERRDLIARLVDAAKINWTHVAIAQLVHFGYVDRVLTTNFDLLVPRACAMVGEFPAIYDFAASPDFKHAQILNKAVFSLHGQYTGFRLVNTGPETMAQYERIKPVLADSLAGRPVIVAGYSGENDPVFTFLASHDNFEYRLYWSGYDQEPSSHLSEKLLADKDKDAHYLGGWDADAFFEEIAKKLGAYPPMFIGAPFVYLNALLDRVAPRSPGGTSDDLIAHTRAYLRKAEAAVKHADDEESSKTALLHEAESRLLAGDTDAVVRLLPPADPASADLLAWSHITAGDALFYQAKGKAGREADHLYELAGKKYQAALDIKPDKHEALYNWGNALADQAKQERADQADHLYELAGKKYQAALDIKPDKHEALLNWGVALSDQAKKKARKEANRLYTLAGEKYAEAVKIKPDKHEALFSWGNALFERAKGSSGTEADGLYTLAGKKYAAAVDIKRDMHEALNNWGTALWDQAKGKAGEEADRLYALAGKKYEEALAVKPDKFEALNNWGNALSDQARRKTKEDADRLYSLAWEKYRNALDIKPDFRAALLNWHKAVLNQAQYKAGPRREALNAKAEELLRRVAKLRPDTYKLACLMAQNGRHDECRTLLDLSLQEGTLPDPDHLRNDPDLAPVRNYDWFRRLTGEFG